MKNRVLENRYVVNSIRLVLCVLSIGLLYLSFLSVSYLNRTPYVGFDYRDHPLLTLVENPPAGLQLGDVLVHINGSRIVGTRSWQEILNSLPRDESIPLTVNRNGRPTNIRLSASRLDNTVFAYRPESVALIVTQAPPGSRLKDNDRILSISGIGVETGKENRILDLLTDQSNKPLTIVFMHQGSVGVYIADPGSLAELETRFIHKYPVIVTEVDPGAGLPLKPGDQILSINGHAIWNRDSLDHQLNALPFGSSLILYFHSGADYQTTRSSITLSLWDRRYSGNLLYLIVIVLGFILTLFLLFQLRDQLLGYYQSLLMLSIFSLLLAGWKLARPHIPYPDWILLPFIGLLPLSIYLFLNYFPIQLHRLKRLDWPQRLLTVLMIATIISGAGNWVSLSVLTEWSKIIGLILSTLLLAYSLHILLLTRKTYERSSQRLIYIGIILGFLFPFIAFGVEVAMPSTMRSLVSSLLILGFLNVPLVVLYSHIRKRVLYTDVIFKKSFSYTIVSGIILFSYFLVVVWMGKHIHTLLKIDNIWIMLIFLLLAAFLVEPLKNIVTRLTDRLFYRTQVGYREYILESSSQLNYLMEISSIIDLVLNKVCDIAYISGGYIALWDETEERYKCRAARDSEISDFREIAIPPDWQMVAWLMDRREPIELFDHRNYKQFIDLPEAEHKLLERLNVSVIAPFISRNELIGFLMLKRKLSGELYSYEDINFLGILCNQAAIALENALFREKEKALLHSMYQQKRLALMGQMSANIAHEIRNPLVAIKGLGKLVEESFDSADRRKEHMKVLNSEVSRLQNVVSDLVKFARPTSLDIKEVDLNDLLEDIALLYREECRRRGVTFDVVHHGQPVMVPIDGEKIKQALINLVQNSLEAMVNGGQISLEAIIIEHSNFSNIYSTLARIRITDSGPGIPPDLREKVFEPFFTSKKTGTGLGLAIARDIIEEHGGHIRITDSLVEGVPGITFELDFPLQPTPKGGVS